MARANPLLESFNAGEFSGLLASRLSFNKYPFGAAVMRNFLPLVEGGMTMRPGSRYVATAGDSTTAGRLMPFVFSTVQAYILELQNTTMRFYRNQGQITVTDTDASVTNGTFDANITNWDDNSSGGASIAWALLQGTDLGTFSVAGTSGEEFGDAADALTKHVGLLFLNTDASTLVQVRVKTESVHTVNGPCVAKIYTTSSGSPGTQVGSDSDSVSINAATTEFVFTWSSGTPTLSASTSYWAIISNTDTALDTNLESIGDQGANFATGSEDTITSIADATGPAAGWGQGSRELRIEVLVDPGSANGALALVGSAGETSIAEQDITTTNTDQEHVLKFRVIGAPGDTIAFRVGSVSTGSSILNTPGLGVGYHSIAFTPDASPFYIQFDNTQAKTVYIDDVSLIDNAALSLTTPYLTADLFELKHSQSADVLYITHRDYPVYKLSRSGHTTWSLTEVRFEDGPYFPENETTTTLDPSATTGLGISLVWSSTDGLNGGDGLSVNDIGRSVRFSNDGAKWGWCIITDVTDTLNATADVIFDFPGGHTAQISWRLGQWSATPGYPSTSTFYEQRNIFAATDDNPQTFWATQSADLENMTEDNREATNDETVEDDDALNFTLAGMEVNAIRWMQGGQNLFIGTNGGEWLVKSDGPVLTPTDIDAKQHTSHGSADVQSIQAGHASLYLHRSKRKFQELLFDDLIQGLKSPDLTVLAPHVLTSGVTQLAYQEEPDNVVWNVRSDGQLATLTYERDENVVAWSRQIMGGSFSTGEPVVESVAVIPGNNGAGQTFNSEDRDEVWLVVKRTVNSSTVRFVEFLEGIFTGPNRDDFATDALYETQLLSDQENAFYVDAGLTYDSTPTTTITGLGHLEGETVAVWADGKEQANKTVSSGSITIDSASKAQVGLSYTYAYKSLKNRIGAQRGTPVGQRSRIHKVEIVYHESLSGQIGPNQATLFDIPFPAAISGTTKPLFTGELEVDDFDGDWESDPRIFIQDSSPAPATIIGIAPRISVNEL